MDNDTQPNRLVDRGCTTTLFFSAPICRVPLSLYIQARNQTASWDILLPTAKWHWTSVALEAFVATMSSLMCMRIDGENVSGPWPWRMYVVDRRISGCIPCQHQYHPRESADRILARDDDSLLTVRMLNILSVLYTTVLCYRMLTLNTSNCATHKSLGTLKMKWIPFFPKVTFCFMCRTTSFVVGYPLQKST